MSRIPQNQCWAGRRTFVDIENTVLLHSDGLDFHSRALLCFHDRWTDITKKIKRSHGGPKAKGGWKLARRVATSGAKVLLLGRSAPSDEATVFIGAGAVGCFFFVF